MHRISTGYSSIPSESLNRYRAPLLQTRERPRIRGCHVRPDQRPVRPRGRCDIRGTEPAPVQSNGRFQLRGQFRFYRVSDRQQR